MGTRENILKGKTHMPHTQDADVRRKSIKYEFLMFDKLCGTAKT